MNKQDKLDGFYLTLVLPALAFVTTGAAALSVLYGSTVIAVAMTVLAIASFALIASRHFRYVRRIKEKAASSETAERFRAEMAETHLAELQHYVSELERSSMLLRESRERFRHAALHDSLTGLANRNKFVDLIAAKVKEGSQIGLLYLDLDRFKTVNDSLGHSIGDELIREVAARLVTVIGDRGVVGRFSGDEFAILIYGPVSAGVAEDFAAIVCRSLAHPFELTDRQLFTSVSVGIAIADDRYSEPEDLIRDADIAMYCAKETAQSVIVFDKIMHARAVSLLQLETDLRLAVARSEFELYYQPIVDMDDVSLMGFEALVRWNHPNRGLITPNEFISVAENTGLLIPMTDLLLREACRQLYQWQYERKIGPRAVISVNLSSGFLTKPNVVGNVRSILMESGIQPGCLKLEITESAVMDNAESVVEVLKELKELGVKISIDDFGTGYSSLSYLHRFPIHTLKIDRSFVSAMEEGTENGEIVRTVIALAKALKLSVIAEGIESIHQFHQLRVLGCEFGQGYLFSRPLPQPEIEKLLADKTRWRNILPTIDIGAVARNREYSQMRIQ